MWTVRTDEPMFTPQRREQVRAARLEWARAAAPRRVGGIARREPAIPWFLVLRNLLASA